ncbi:hypothetical protein GTQ99_00615 [Kineococcus sp. T13]|uniref:hypothetical protein n=1 Tax=Kineococcus vitellinus TaxID=2696565 RepID=UPI001411ED14|nr:hypothetical protein [Kineococcus vitellinus]NAZ73934.1 hypothetical protein [Kineococcus vitellinus]
MSERLQLFVIAHPATEVREVNGDTERIDSMMYLSKAGQSIERGSAAPLGRGWVDGLDSSVEVFAGTSAQAVAEGCRYLLSLYGGGRLLDYRQAQALDQREKAERQALADEWLRLDETTDQYNRRTRGEGFEL